MTPTPTSTAPIPTNAATAVGDGEIAGGGAGVGVPALTGMGLEIAGESGPVVGDGVVVVVMVVDVVVVGAGAFPPVFSEAATAAAMFLSTWSAVDMMVDTSPSAF